MSKTTLTPQRAAWVRSAKPLVKIPMLETDIIAETTIIGAGYAGLNAAIRLAECGRTAVVLEAREPGFGASGRNGGQVIPGLKHDPDKLVAMLGPGRGGALVEFVGNAAGRTFDLIENYQMDCGARRCGWLQPAVDDKTLALIGKRARIWKDVAGVRATILDAAETEKATGTRFYTGSWIDPRGGQLQPMSYVRELARVACANGVRIFRDSPATKIERGEGIWRVAVNGKTVKSQSVLVCTNGYTGRLIPGLDMSLIPASSIICSTAPLSSDIKAQIMPAGCPISDARRLLNYMRFDPEGRFMIGARGSFGLHEPESYFRRLEATAEKIFPALKHAAWEDAWGGRFALTVDHLPHIHNPEPGLFTVLGCNGRGVAMLSQLGRLLAELISGEMSREASPLSITPLQPIRFPAFRRPALEAAALWYQTLDRLGL